MGNLAKLKTKAQFPNYTTENLINDLRKTFFNDLELLAFEPFKYNNQSFPPYNIYESGENGFVIEMALAGYSKDDIEVVIEDNKLKISSNKVEESVKSEETEFYHRGIAKRSFTNQFRIPEHAEVEECTMKDGILRISVVRNIPEEKLPKVIEIK